MVDSLNIPIVLHNQLSDKVSDFIHNGQRYDLDFISSRYPVPARDIVFPVERTPDGMVLLMLYSP